MTDRELMQWALDALDGYARNCRCEGGGAPCDAAEALRARLAQPEQEPAVKWDASAPLVVHPHPAFQATQPDLAQVGEVGVWGERQWQGLTNDEVNNFAAGCHLGKSVQGAIYEAAAKLKEKNT